MIPIFSVTDEQILEVISECIEESIRTIGKAKNAQNQLSDIQGKDRENYHSLYNLIQIEEQTKHFLEGLKHYSPSGSSKNPLVYAIVKNLLRVYHWSLLDIRDTYQKIEKGSANGNGKSETYQLCRELFIQEGKLGAATRIFKMLNCTYRFQDLNQDVLDFNKVELYFRQ